MCRVDYFIPKTLALLHRDHLKHLTAVSSSFLADKINTDLEAAFKLA